MIRIVATCPKAFLKTCLSTVAQIAIFHLFHIQYSVKYSIDSLRNQIHACRELTAVLIEASSVNLSYVSGLA